MLDGWYCRTLASEQQAAQQMEQIHQEPNEDSDSESPEREVGPAEAASNAVDYKNQYRYLKRKLKFLIYENEFFQDALRSNQRRLIKVSKDRAFLLDRLLQYEKPENTSSESEETEESSEDEATKELKRRKLDQAISGSATNAPRGRKKKNVIAPNTAPESKSIDQTPALEGDNNQQAQSESESQLCKRSDMGINPERAPATVPTDMFSNEPSLDSESNEHLADVSSPTHVAAEECVPMEYIN